MYFEYSPALLGDFPEVVAAVISVEGISRQAPVRPRVEAYQDLARQRLAARAESELPEIQAWRRAFAKTGLKPTQYRCAAEALLRRLRKEGDLPRIHPAVDLCNAVSVAFAIPVAVLDASRVSAFLEAGYARGDETYQTFAGTVEHPDPGEVVFVDADRQAHARRWTNRQSGLSATRDETSSALIVAEGLHASAGEDVPRLAQTLVQELADGWSAKAVARIVTREAPRAEF